METLLMSWLTAMGYVFTIGMMLVTTLTVLIGFLVLILGFFDC